MAETIEHRIIRSKSAKLGKSTPLITEMGDNSANVNERNLLPEHHYIPRPPRHMLCEPTSLPEFITECLPKVQSTRRHY